jgi:RimJ/RimL family protein N-acetyltransferase
MFGPTFEVQDQTVALKKIAPRDTGKLPYHVDARTIEYLSSESQQKIRELVSWGSGATIFKWWREGRDRVTWGQYIRERFDEKLVGYTGFEMTKSPSQGIDAQWQQAESYMFLLNSAYLGKGIATRTHPYRTVFGLSLGIDCLQASTIVGNERSRRALLRTGYVELGKDPELDIDGERRTSFRLYSPDLAELAVEHAMSQADQRKNNALTPDMIRAAQGQVHDLQQSLPEVEEAARYWYKYDGNASLFVPKDI